MLYTIYALQKLMQAVSVQAWTGPKGTRRLRFPEYLDKNGT